MDQPDSGLGSLDQLIDLMKTHGATRIYAKRLAPNDNSKNQVYLGGDFSALNILPHGDIYTDRDFTSGSKRDRAKAKIHFYWVDRRGRHHAPDAGLILYPQYPEVRMSGFLKGCASAPSSIMSSRNEGRILFIGITKSGDILGYAASADAPVSIELASCALSSLGIFLEIPLDQNRSIDTKLRLLERLRHLYNLNWIASQKLTEKTGIAPYSATNGGGYTLEAYLGIAANSKAGPDYLGWEIKQYGVGDFIRFTPKSPVTLFTPEPNYSVSDAATFVRKFGYADKGGKRDRLNFGGVYAQGKALHKDTGLRITLDGFDPVSGKMTNFEGGLQLIDYSGDVAAEWKFTTLMDHWNRKHAKAAYVPSIFQTPPPEYAFGPKITLCEQTDFILFLKAFAAGKVYYDPALKLESSSDPKSRAKARSQFRIKHSDIAQMYHNHEVVDLRV
jgi:MvaI/BcnI restriction endonuclease family